MGVHTVLVRPPVDVLHKFSKPVECLGIAYCAGALRQAGLDVTMLDGMLHDWSEQETVQRILALNPDLVGFTVILNHFPDSTDRICRLLRESGFRGRIVIGGHAVSFIPQRVLDGCPAVDAVVSGEGEGPIVGYATALAEGRDPRTVPGVYARHGGEVRWRPAPRVRDLDRLAPPARDLTQDLIDLDGLVCVSTSRGCYARCTFCSIPRFYGLERDRPLANGSWLARSVAHTVAEIVDLHERFGLIELLIVDDEFFGGTEAGHARALMIGQELEALALPLQFAMSCRAENVDAQVLAALARGGLKHVFVGLETGDDETLRLYGKGHSVQQNLDAVRIIKSLGLSFQPGFMLFNHRATISEIQAGLDFLREIGELKPVTVNSAVDPHFGTPLNRVIEHDGALRDLGSSLASDYLDPRTAVAKRVAEETAARYAPYQEVVAGLQSSVTFEWRRTVPGRDPAVSRAIDLFEKTCNAAFVAVVEQAVQDLSGQDAPSPGEVLARTEQRLASVESRMSLAKALLLGSVAQAEGEVRYYTQNDVIAMRQGVGR
ncbi:anaerobic magnesium-protoporphyrin IX monomethyl ester cyclase [Kitasatospora sp. MAP12-15]|uniref:B12-binding domain-containing radical SAM protein n=1 Tax=unclassified Kitasatospora TaxID=2633591 RepID=UPI0024739F99|nr:radical SAM protein [Kitasatospora sp. MAP12-44]MDH6113587.1 anaerobic magnesium-protoporphyrin IX monomethyl ester cyclase [Kitasatospora sp. MAP12-44]